MRQVRSRTRRSPCGKSGAPGASASRIPSLFSHGKVVRSPARRLEFRPKFILRSADNYNDRVFVHGWPVFLPDRWGCHAYSWAPPRRRVCDASTLIGPIPTMNSRFVLSRCTRTRESGERIQEAPSGYCTPEATLDLVFGSGWQSGAQNATNIT